MKAVRDEGYFSLSLKDDVLVVVMRNTEAMPSINYHAMTHMFQIMQEVISEEGLVERGWCVLYDFSGLEQYEMTAATAFANFFRWARRNGRIKAAHIFPAARKDGEVSLIKRVILSLVTQIAKADNDHYSASDQKDALRWFKEVRQTGKA